MPRRDTRDDLSSKINNLTKLLCETCGKLGDEQLQRAAAWRQAYQAADKTRVLAEQEALCSTQRASKIEKADVGSKIGSII